MRTTPFKRVFDKAIRWRGFNPYKEIPSDERDSMVDRINDRVRTIITSWPWPEWTVTEQRAFRQIWNPEHQYLRVNQDGNPDEVFYLETLSYYQVLTDTDDDPPIGTIPTDTDWWRLMDSSEVGTYISYDQVCRRSIGMVNGIYQRNPSGCNCDQSGLLKYHPSQNGIEICQPGLPTVWINYQMPVPRYTMIPYAAGKVYQRADVVFDPISGDCFQAHLTTINGPGTADWMRVPFLEKWERPVVLGAFADMLGESDLTGNIDVQQRQLLALKAQDNADLALQNEIDTLSYQGQLLQWSRCKRNGYWCESSPWDGGDVSAISDDCEEGWIFPPPPPIFPPPVPGFHCPTPSECPEIAYLGEPNLFRNVNTIPGIRFETRPIDTDYQLTAIDFSVPVDDSTDSRIITLPLALGTGQLYHIKKVSESENQVIITAQTGDLIDGDSTKALNLQWEDITLQDAGLGYWDKWSGGVGELPDLSDFARKSLSNAFLALNSFTGLQFATRTVFASDDFGELDFTILADATGGPITLTLPEATGSGQIYHAKKIDSTDEVVTIAAQDGDFIDGSILAAFVFQWDSILLQDAAPGYWDNVGSEVSGGGGTIDNTTNLIAGDGAGDGVDSGIAPGNVVIKQIAYPTPTNSEEIIACLQAAGLCA